MADDPNINISQELSSQLIVHKNLNPKVVIVDMAKLKNMLRDYRDAVKGSHDWISILALVLSLLLTNITSTFNDFWGLSAEVWKAIFVICLAGSIIWLIVVIIRLISNHKERQIEHLIDQITDSKR